MPLIDITINKINTLLIKNLNPILVYLFGSYAKETNNKNSDIDLAFLSDTDLSDYEIYLLSQDLAETLEIEVDLIDLKKASTVFKAQVIGTGKTIYCKDNIKKMYFEMQAFKDYAVLNEQRSVILGSIKERGNIYG